MAACLFSKLGDLHLLPLLPTMACRVRRRPPVFSLPIVSKLFLSFLFLRIRVHRIGRRGASRRTCRSEHRCDCSGECCEQVCGCQGGDSSPAQFDEVELEVRNEAAESRGEHQARRLTCLMPDGLNFFGLGLERARFRIQCSIIPLHLQLPIDSNPAHLHPVEMRW